MFKYNKLASHLEKTPTHILICYDAYKNTSQTVKIHEAEIGYSPIIFKYTKISYNNNDKQLS